MKLNVKGFALASGVLWGAGMFLGTLALRAAGGKGETIGKLAAVYPGYALNMRGAVFGLVYGLVTGFVFGGLFAWLYNKFTGKA